MSNVTMKQLLEAGVHFGHQSRRWNPKMKPYIYTERNGIYIIDLKKTLRLLRDACRFVRDEVAKGSTVLFVGTKKQAKEIIMECADAAGMYYVNNRWLGGLLTNFKTVRRSVLRLIELEKMFETGTINQYVKKEQSALQREMLALRKNLNGIKGMDRLPDIMFVIDPGKEGIAILEAKKLGIPVVSVVDTNCDPDNVSWVIPGNDDAIRSIKLMCQAISDSCVEGKANVGEGGYAEMMASDSQQAQTGAPQTSEPHAPLSAAELEQRFAVFQGAPAEAAPAEPQQV